MNATLLSVIVTLVLAIFAGLAQAFHLARKFGHYETERDQMKSDIKGLKDDSLKHGALDTAVQLLTQSMGTLNAAISDLRTESREGRQEMRDAVAELKSETREAMTEMRQDLRASIKRPN